MVATALVVLCVAAVPAQEPASQPSRKIVPECKLADLDSNVIFVRSGDEFIVAFNQQNISAEACIPRTSHASPQFDPTELRDAKPFGECLECEDRLPNGQYPVHKPVVLNAGETGYQTFRWKTVAPNETVKCLKLYSLFGPILTATPTLLRPVCSEIAVSRTYAGEFVLPAEKEKSHTDEIQTGETM